MIRVKKIVLLALLVFSIQSFSQKIEKGDEKKITRTQYNKDSTIKTVTITITRTDTIKTRYSPEIKEIKQTLEKYWKYNEKIENLETEIDTKTTTIIGLRNDEKKLTKRIENLKTKKEDFETELNNLKEKEKDNVKIEINFIIQQNSNSYSNKILSITKKRAEDNEVDPNLIDVLKSYISIRKELVESRDLLNKPYNKINIDKILIELDNIYMNPKFFGLIKEKDEIVDLLDSYKEKCTQLFNKLKYLEDYRANAKNIKIELDTEFQKDYEDYPYLSKIIVKNQKVKDWKSLIFCK